MVLWTQVGLAGLWGGLLALERRAFLQAMFSRPLVAATSMGMLLGEPESGLFIGTLFELYYLGAANLGAALPENDTLAATGCTAAAAAFAAADSGTGTPAMWSLSILMFCWLGVLGRRIDRALEPYSSNLARTALSLAERGELVWAVRRNLWGMWPHFLISAALVGGCSVVGSVLGPWVHGLPLPLVRGLAWAFPAMTSVAAAIAVRGSHARHAGAYAGATAAIVAIGLFALAARGDVTVAPEPLGSWTLWRVFARSLFLQAAWNPHGMQNLGLAYALYPALVKLYPERDQQMAAVRRHLAFFNTHPYVAAAILGGVLHYEARIARGEEQPQKVISFKAALMGPLAALGDGFFWLSLRPAVGALCAALVPILQEWAAALFLVLYNAVHLTLRLRLFRMGLSQGDGLVESLGKARLPVWGARLRTVAACSAGGAVAYLAARFGANQGAALGGALMAGCLGMGALSYWLVNLRFGNYALLYLAAAMAVAAGALL